MSRSASYALQDKFLGLYFQDDFKLSRRVTLNLGFARGDGVAGDGAV